MGMIAIELEDWLQNAQATPTMRGMCTLRMRKNLMDEITLTGNKNFKLSDS